ncbi:hypothetical protein BDF21DRAFT_402861 [Thamnidium elegans]|nr:hypothetical protein BDF21DRAFT_402861 [Thamnidium elegans]
MSSICSIKEYQVITVKKSEVKKPGKQTEPSHPVKPRLERKSTPRAFRSTTASHPNRVSPANLRKYVPSQSHRGDQLVSTTGRSVVLYPAHTYDDVRTTIQPRRRGIESINPSRGFKERPFRIQQ